MTSDALENLMNEDRSFPPPPEFAAQANAGAGLYAEAASDRLGFWADQARQLQERRRRLPVGGRDRGPGGRRPLRVDRSLVQSESLLPHRQLGDLDF